MKNQELIVLVVGAVLTLVVLQLLDVGLLASIAIGVVVCVGVYLLVTFVRRGGGTHSGA